MKELGNNTGSFDDDMGLKFENSTAASEGQKAKKEYGVAPTAQQKGTPAMSEPDFLYGGPTKTDSTSFSMGGTDFFSRDESAKPKEDTGYQVTLPKPG